MKIFKNKNQKGYAILFTVVVVSIISLIAIGLSNSSYKQLVLSSVAKDSNLAFYQSDTATECALYVDNHMDMSPANGAGSNWDCGINTDGSPYTLSATPGTLVGNETEYLLDPVDYTTSEPCFSIIIHKSVVDGSTDTHSKGYNICDTSNLRKVEREIEVKY